MDAELRRELVCIVKDLDSSIMMLKAQGRSCFVDEMESLKNRIEVLLL